VGYKDEIEKRVHLHKPGLFIIPPTVREYPLYIQVTLGTQIFAGISAKMEDYLSKMKTMIPAGL
jgi:hypothetical protein